MTTPTKTVVYVGRRQEFENYCAEVWQMSGRMAEKRNLAIHYAHGPGIATVRGAEEACE